VVVILSTHIVDDVSDLCSQMAVINAGALLLAGAPEALTQTLKGRVWRRAIEAAELADYQARMQVLAHRLRAGRTVIHVLADSEPGPGFESIEGSLEDLYFATLAEARATATGHATGAAGSRA
jgi:ABC-type multidrug transport system ATPase subunit